MRAGRLPISARGAPSSMTPNLQVFVSSSLDSLRQERAALSALLTSLTSAAARVTVWAYEEAAPASSRSVRELYLEALRRSDLYIGLFQGDLGQWTIDEYEQAGRWGIARHIYVHHDHVHPHSRGLRAFLDRIAEVTVGVAPCRFTDLNDLLEKARRSTTQWLDERLALRSGSDAALIVRTFNELPWRARPFVGREHQLAEATHAIVERHAVLVHGMPGAGKTAFAAELAAWTLASYGGPALWHSVGSFGYERVSEILLKAFARTDDPNAGLLQAIASRGVRVLVLDDVWLPSLLDRISPSPNLPLRVIVTSRFRHPDYEVIELQGLDDRASVALLRHAMKRMPQDSTPEALSDERELCKRLGNNPSAILLAARQTNEIRAALARDEWPIDSKRAQLMLSDTAGIVPTGLLGLLDECSNNLRSLGSDGQLASGIFNLMGAFFSAQITAEMAAESMFDALDSPLGSNAYDMTSSSVQRALSLLVESGLMNAVPATSGTAAHFRLNGLPYLCIAGRSTSSERHRAVCTCVGYARKMSARGADGFPDLQAELPNLLGACRFAAVERLREELEALTWCLQGRDEFLSRTGNFRPLAEIMSLAVTGIPPDDEQAATYMGELANALYRVGDYREAIEYAGRALATSTTPSDTLAFRTMIALSHAGMGDVAQAIEELQDVVDVARAATDHRAETTALGNLGNLYADLGQRVAERACHQRALMLSRALGDRRLQAQDLINLGNSYLATNDHPEAVDHYERATRILEETGDRVGASHARANLGQALMATGDHDRACAVLGQAQAFFRESSDTANEASCLLKLGDVQAAARAYDAASRTYEEALRLSRSAGHLRQEASVLTNLGTLQAELRDYSQARLNFEQAMSLVRSVGDRTLECELTANLAAIYVALGEVDRAKTHGKAALALARATSNRSIEAASLANLASLDSSQGRYRDAIDQYENARALFASIGDERRAAECESHVARARTSLLRPIEWRDPPTEPVIFGQLRAVDYAADGVRLANNGDLGPALDALSRAVALDSANADYAAYRATVCGELGNHADAIRGFTEAIRLKPEHADFYYNRGCVHAATSDLDAAIADFSMAVRLDPSSIDARFNLGAAHLNRGDLGAGISEFRRVLELDPENHRTNLALGTALLQQGNLEEAVPFLQRARTKASSE